jgi:hypothetical protein
MANGMPPLIITGRHALPLPGWDDYSLWGLDRSEATYGLFAQLWRNTDDGDERPRHLITEVQDLLELARRIAALTACTEDAVADAIMVGLRSIGAGQGI